MFVARRCLGSVLSAVGGVFALGVGAGLVRLLPWLLSPEVPLEVSWPFAVALLVAAGEAAFLVGVPIGVALGVAAAVEAGEIRALMALGVSPARLAAATLPLVLAAMSIQAGASLALGSEADRPGRFAAELVRQARGGCARATEPGTAVVPLVGVTWLCFPGEPPRISGPLPRAGDRAWFTASGLTPSDDLTAVHVTDLRLAARDDRHRTVLRVAVAEGHIRGLPGWGRSGKLPAEQRAWLVAVGALIACLGATWLVARHSLASRLVAMALAALPALSVLTALGRLDSTSSVGPKLVALGAPLALICAFAALIAGAQRLARVRRR